MLSISGGAVYVQTPGSGDWKKATEGMTLEVNYKVKTDSGSKAKITFFEGSTIELNGDTVVSLSELGMEGAATKIKVKQEIGETVSHVQKLVDPASRYDIETTAAVAAVRGTILFVGAYSNGNTVVGNIQGLVVVIAQGIEVELEENTHSTVTPGNAPGDPEPGSTPTPPAGSSSTTTPSGDKIGIEIVPERASAFEGDNFKYSYKISNPGNAALREINITSDKTLSAELKSGDSNGDKMLDPSETWVFTGEYLIKAGEAGTLVNTASVYGKDSKGKSVTASGTASVTVEMVKVTIDSLQDGQTVGEGIILAGSVNDPSVTEVTMEFDGVASILPVTDSKFSTNLHLEFGQTHTLKVTVTKAGGVSVSESYTLEPKNEGK
jgi:hypothetical protein